MSAPPPVMQWPTLTNGQALTPLNGNGNFLEITPSTGLLLHVCGDVYPPTCGTSGGQGQQSSGNAGIELSTIDKSSALQYGGWTFVVTNARTNSGYILSNVQSNPAVVLTRSTTTPNSNGYKVLALTTFLISPLPTTVTVDLPMPFGGRDSVLVPMHRVVGSSL